MSDLIKKDGLGVLRLIRVAEKGEFVQAKLNNRMVIVFDSGENNKNSLFTHDNKVGKKIYRTLKVNLDFDIKVKKPKLDIKLDKKIDKKVVPLQQEKNHEGGAKLGELLDSETRKRLLALKKGNSNG